ncbi:MAG: T9SS type A sorting domain-containing protein, partial [Saprospiraceae bacterium]|nr:T9SS type A sorting domain-containing protein [Saprospiraceae bacterium]
WSTGATTAGIQDLSPGAYTVTVTDENGCSASQTVTVNAFGCALTAELHASDVLCFGDSTGSAAVTAMGNFGPVSVTWSTGDTGMTVSGLPAGPYNVTVVDTSNCSVSLNVVITQPDALALDCAITPASGPGSADGSIACNVSGGMPPYAYAWDSGDTTSSLSDLTPGIYTLTVTDANGCTTATQVEVEAADCTVEVSFVLEDVACHGDTTGSAMVLPSNGTTPYQFSWSTGDTTSAVVGLAAGAYMVTITDSVGCQEIGTFTINQPDPLIIQLDSAISASNGMANGGILITIEGGVPPYSFEWNQGGPLISTDEDPTGLMAGLYEVDVVDANGCSTGLDNIEVPLVSSTGIPSQQTLISVWPNPVGDHLRVSLNHPVPRLRITLLDAQGTALVQQTITGTDARIDMHHMSPGMYFLHLYGPGVNRVNKLIRLEP